MTRLTKIYAHDYLLDIDECHSPGYCYGDCKNTEGGYLCQCPLGLTGNASIPNGCKGIRASPTEGQTGS